jgi:hypothetical protein
VQYEIEIGITAERIAARVIGRPLAFEGPNRVAVVPHKGREVVAGIGDGDTGVLGADGVSGARLVDVVADDAFDAPIAAGVVGFLGVLMWDRLHRGWRGPLGFIDHGGVRVAIDGYTGLDPATRRAFTRALPYNPNLTWWVEGAEVRY